MMPFAKVLFLADAMKVLKGEVTPERGMSKNEKILVKHLEDNKEQWIKEMNDLLNTVNGSEETVGGLYEQ